MATGTLLDIRGYDGQPVPHQLIRPQGADGRLAVLLPGFAYTLDMPLFSYVEDFLIHGGTDVLRVEYAYDKAPGFFEATDPLPDARLAADVTAAVRAALAQRPYRELILVGKSIGTLAMAIVLTRPDRYAGPVRAVWLTPAFGLPGLTARMAMLHDRDRDRDRSLVIIGDADHHYAATALARLAATLAPELLVIPGADHSLEVPGGIDGSVGLLPSIIQAMTAFLRD